MSDEQKLFISTFGSTNGGDHDGRQLFNLATHRSQSLFRDDLAIDEQINPIAGLFEFLQ